MPADAGSKRLVAWALAVLLLALGAAGGVAADRLLLRADAPRRGHGPPTPEELVERMTRDLDLTDGQRQDVRVILENRWRAHRALFARVDPEAEAIREEANARIRFVLTPPQRERFEAQVAEAGRRRAELRARMERPRTEPATR